MLCFLLSCLFQIVKRKKKGRPSKADLARREPPDLRRSIRRRNVRYTFDYDDYIDDEEDDYEEEEEDERRREKKLELLLKFQVKESRGTTTTTTESAPSQTRRVSHAPADSPSSSDYGGGGSKPLKKRKIDGVNELKGDVDDTKMVMDL